MIYTDEEKDEAYQRLAKQAEIGCWFTSESTVPVLIGDLYKIFELIKSIRDENNV